MLCPATLCLLTFCLIAQQPLMATSTAIVPLADGFDFPVGPPDAEGYYKYRGFRPNGHLGDDWNGLKGGNSDLGDPVYSIGHGIVVFARDARRAWGNVVIVRHAFWDQNRVQAIDSLYSHLDSITVREGQIVRRNQKVGTIGSNRGMYVAHLHFEIRKNLSIGINQCAFSQGFENYHDPTKFIFAHRKLKNGGRTTRLPISTFTLPDASQNIPTLRFDNNGRSRTGSGQHTWEAARYSDLIHSQH